jgi:hypothetical protein
VQVPNLPFSAMIDFSWAQFQLASHFAWKSYSTYDFERSANLSKYLYVRLARIIGLTRLYG